MSDKKIPVMMTTDKDKRGVFAGLINPEDYDKENLIAEDVRMCVAWTVDEKGVLGLAAEGPTSKCRITKAAPRAHIRGITAIFELTPEAHKRWQSEPWG